MLSKIYVFPRDVVEHLMDCQNIQPLFNVNKWAIISIYGSMDHPLFAIVCEEDRMKENGCVGALSLQFDDLILSKLDEVTAREMRKKYIPFDSNMAIQIIDFIEEIKDKCELLIVHCAAGVSRSGAIGEWVMEYLGLNNEEFNKVNPCIVPNGDVKRIMYNVSGIKG